MAAKPLEAEFQLVRFIDESRNFSVSLAARLLAARFRSFAVCTADSLSYSRDIDMTQPIAFEVELDVPYE
ncbi:MAG: hypothetical protein M3294_08810, partial [Pseudomonadota bacterium]|nr:hypothetical protein [Pseudomonadota bacterium]